MKKFLALFAATTALTACNQDIMHSEKNSSHENLTEEQITMIVDNYIEENPEKIIESINSYLAKMQAEQQKKAFEKKLANPVEVKLDKNTPVRGAENAVITIVGFSDFECPYCSKVNPTLNTLLKKYEGKIKIAYMHLPLPFHKNAKNAALASIAAHNQDKFWEFHDEIFAQQAKLSDKTFLEIAKRLNLDIEKFKADMKSEESRLKLEDDIKAASKFGVSGTPGFLINGIEVSGALPESEFVKVIEQILDAQNK